MIFLLQIFIIVLGFDYRFFGSERGMLSISIFEIVAYLTLAVLVVDRMRILRLGEGSASDSYPMTTRQPMKVYIAWIVAAACLNWVLWSNPDGLHTLKDTIPALILFGAIQYWVRSPRELQSVLASTRMMLLGLAVLGISQYVLGGPHINALVEFADEKLSFTGEGTVARPVVGMMGSPNAFAVFMAPLFVLAVISHCEYSKASLAPWLLRSVGLLAVGTALVLTQAKGVLAVTLFSLAAYVVVRAAPLRAHRILLLLLPIGGVAILGLGIVALAQLQDLLPLGFTLGTMVGRLGLALEAMDLLRLHPGLLVIGGGVELFRRTVPVPFHVHTEYIAQVLMWGLPGCILFVWLLVRTYRSTGSSSWAGPLAVACMALILLIESAGGTQRQGMVFLLLALVGVRSAVERGESVRAPSGTNT